MLFDKKVLSLFLNFTNMKKIVLVILAFAVCATLYSQEIPQVQLKDLKGKVVNSQEII